MSTGGNLIKTSRSETDSEKKVSLWGVEGHIPEAFLTQTVPGVWPAEHLSHSLTDSTTGTWCFAKP